MHLLETIYIDENGNILSLYDKRAVGKGSLNATYSFARWENENGVIDTIKKAENGNDIIIRAYECHNWQNTSPIRFWIWF